MSLRLIDLNLKRFKLAFQKVDDSLCGSANGDRVVNVQVDFGRRFGFNIIFQKQLHACIVHRSILG